MKLLRKFFNTLIEGIKGIWIHKNLGATSITSIFFTLFITGLIIIIVVTVNSIALKIQTKVNDVEIFIKNEATVVQVAELENKINSIDIDKTVEYRSSEEALEIMKESWEDNADLLDNVEAEGLLPASFVVKIANIEEADNFVRQIENEEIVEDVNYYRELVDQVSKLSYYSKLFGIILVVLLMVVSLFIIANTIRLTVISRIHEIAVMKYVGATNSYILIPFLIEGIFYSLLASGLSYLAIYYLYSFVYDNFGVQIANNYPIVSLITPQTFQMSLLQILLSLGLGIGVLGSVLSIRKYLLDREVNYVR